MASSHTDTMMPVRQSIENPTGCREKGRSKQKPQDSALTIEMPPEQHVEPEGYNLDDGEPPSHENCDGNHGSEDASITISSTSKLAGQTVVPFLAKHIPKQYAPMGPVQPSTASKKNPNTKYCYRHRPDSLCRRTVDEPTMEKLQADLGSLSQSDQQGISHVWALFSAAPAKHRNLMLQGILTQCCFPQLSYLSTAVRDLIKIDFIAALPSEISFKILCYLDTTSLCKAAQVSQKWRILADDDVVWHKMCEQHIERKCTKCGWGLPLLERRRLRDWKRQQQLRATGRGLNEWSPRLTPVPDDNGSISVINVSSLGGSNKRDASSMSSDGSSTKSPEMSKRKCTQGLNVEANDSYLSKPRYRPWKDVYKDRFKVGTNWKYGRCSTKIFRGHTNGVTCLQFDDNILATGSYDTTIKIWDLDSGECLRTLRGHTSGLRTLQFDDTKLISGSLDATIKVWNWRTGECLSTYPGHTKGIIGLNFEGNILASGSMDNTVKIWNFKDSSVFTLRGHRDFVNAVRVDSASRTVFSASDDSTVRLWDLDTRSTIKIYEGHVAAIQQIVLLPPEYEPEETEGEDHDDAASSRSSSVGADSSNQMFPLGLCDDSWPPDRPRPARYMLTGALDATVRLWDVATGKCLKTFFGHLEGVWAVASDILRVVSGAEDGMMKVWDARTGKCERTFSSHAGPVTCIGLSDSRICTGSMDDEIRLYSFKSEDDSPREPGSGGHTM